MWWSSGREVGSPTGCAFGGTLRAWEGLGVYNMDPWVILLDRAGAIHPHAASLCSAVGEPRRTIVVGGARRQTPGGPIRVRRPMDRGSAADALIALFHVLAHDVAAQFVLVPGDFQADASVSVVDAIHAALMEDQPDEIHLIGAERGRCRPGAPWILPVGWGDDVWPRVRAVVGQDVDVRGMASQGALLCTGVVVGSAWRLATMVRAARPDWFRALRRGAWWPADVENAYNELEAFDVFDDVLLPVVETLRVIPALPWNRPDGEVKPIQRSRTPTGLEAGA